MPLMVSQLSSDSFGQAYWPRLCHPASIGNLGLGAAHRRLRRQVGRSHNFSVPNSRPGPMIGGDAGQSRAMCQASA